MTRLGNFYSGLEFALAGMMMAPDFLLRVDQTLPGPHKNGLHELDGYRSEEHTSELQSLMRISYAVLCLKKKKADTSSKTQTHSSTTTKMTTITNFYCV